jgi:NADH:ubiquinone oxidoreductase subunit 3 (subunit A)
MILNLVVLSVILLIISSVAFFLPTGRRISEKTNLKKADAIFEFGTNPTPDAVHQWIFRHFPGIFLFFIFYCWFMVLLIWIVGLASEQNKLILRTPFIVFNGIMLSAYIFTLTAKIFKRR